MEKKRNISLYRERLDKTLTSPNLASKETLKALIKNQILRSSESETEENIDNVVDRKTVEVSKILDMLKSASVNEDQGLKTAETPHGAWKLKQDTDECRVMYREGPEGTPFHTLLVEGYIDGPMDVCLCISWESSLYKKWWPQSTVPTFRILSSQCLQQVRVGEQISLVRMKLSWPLSAREVVVHYFAFEYFQDDLVVVLLNSISDLESIDKVSHGFTKDGIPNARDVVRIDLVGGFAIQKVSPERSYFRTIANMDIKLDFVPPSLINFISRQLIGSGFKLYQKEVTSVLKGDEDFSKALKDPLYCRIREALYSDNKQEITQEPEDLENSCFIRPEENHNTNLQPQDSDIDDMKVPSENLKSNGFILPEENQRINLLPEESSIDDMKVLPDNLKSNGLIFPEENQITNLQLGECDTKVLTNGPLTKFLPKDTVDQKALDEIEEIEEDDMEENGQLEEDRKESYTTPTNHIAETCRVDNKEVIIKPEVEQALGTLERVISMIRDYGFNIQTRSLPNFTQKEFQDLENSAPQDLKSSEDDHMCTNGGVLVENSQNEATGRRSIEPRTSSGSHSSRRLGSNSFSKEANHNRIAPSSPGDLPNPSETHQPAFASYGSETTEATNSDKTTNGNKVVSADANGNSESKPYKGKKSRFCCSYFVLGVNGS